MNYIGFARGELLVNALDKEIEDKLDRRDLWTRWPRKIRDGPSHSNVRRQLVSAYFVDFWKWLKRRVCLTHTHVEFGEF